MDNQSDDGLAPESPTNGEFEDLGDEVSAPPPTEPQEEDVEAVTVGDGEDVMSAILGGGGGTVENMSIANNSSSSSPAPVSVPREEPETIKAWRKEHETQLQEKDAKEAKQMEELKVKAKKDLEDWYKKYTEQLEKTKSDNRKSEKTFVAEMDEIKPGTEWDRVSKLCEFNSKNNKNAKDQSRMRSILLQLKQNPKPIASN